MPATNSLERALILLKIIEQTPGGLRNTDISRRLGIAKSSCSYIVTRLAREGYLVKDAASKRYKIGLTPVALAHGALREVGIRTVAEPALYKLTAQTGLSAGLGVLQGGRVLLVDRVEGPQFVDRAIRVAAKRTGVSYRARAQRDIGRALPAHSTALGKVLLAFLPGQQSKLSAELNRVRAQRYAISDGEVYPDLRALAVPIFDADGQVRAAVSVNGNPKDPVWDDIPALVRTVEEAARDISWRARILPRG